MPRGAALPAGEPVSRRSSAADRPRRAAERSAAGRSQATSRRVWAWGAGLLVLATAIGLALRPPPGGADRPIGSTALCKRPPAFAAAWGFSGNAALSTQNPRLKGLSIQEGERVQQHPSWTQAGSLGPPILDAAGNAYVIPVPYVHVLDNPAEKQNQVYKVDSRSGEMRVLADLPVEAPPSAMNPFGLMGLSYDCDLDRLYASSLSGSDAQQERGRIFQVNPASGAVLDVLEGIDVMGLTTFNGAQGKRLYFGSARRSEVLSIALEADGSFSAEAPRMEFSLAEHGRHGDEKARRLVVGPDGTMTVSIMTFDYNLVANSERLQTRLSFTYQAKEDRWVFEKRANLD